MKPRFIIWFSVVSLFLLRNGSGQTFQNLNFESANLSPVSSGQFGGSVEITNALPGWSGYIGTNQVTTVSQNAVTLGAASIGILGPNWSFGGIIQGNYTLVLQPGADPFGILGENVGASVSQSGLVPANDQSLQFKTQSFDNFSVSLGGQDLILIPLATGTNYTLYGADITPFAGKIETLTFDVSAAPNDANYFDSIVFSPSSVPEPSALSLLSICILYFCWFWRRPHEDIGSNSHRLLD